MRFTLEHSVLVLAAERNIAFTRVTLVVPLGSNRNPTLHIGPRVVNID